jgi:hypothetical protein
MAQKKTMAKATISNQPGNCCYLWSEKLPAAKRFILVLDGEAVLDKETGLVWDRSPNKLNTPKKWIDALIECRRNKIGSRMGWRLPQIEELASLVDPTQSDPALPIGHPFVLQAATGEYWSASSARTVSENSGHAWHLNLSSGRLDTENKNVELFVWAVRGRQGLI